MTFRRKLLALFSLTVFLSVAGVAWTVLLVARSAFERSAATQAATLAGQVRRDFTRRGEDVARACEAIAGNAGTQRIAMSLGHGSTDYASYLDEARAAADDHQLDFLEFLDDQGTIISSAQWAAKFGYKDASLPGLESLAQGPAFLKREELADGATLGIFAVRRATASGQALYVAAGRRVDRDFLAGMELPPGMRAYLYQNTRPGFSPDLLVGPTLRPNDAAGFASLIQRVQAGGKEAQEVVGTPGDRAGAETFHAFPIAGESGRTVAILLVGSERRPFVELEGQIRTAALFTAGSGILLAILFSGWAAAKVTRPLESLAEAAGNVAAGHWDTRVEIPGGGEAGQLAAAFNHMTHELSQQRERLVQAERVAAWRELARRLAHELKNPLFPLQLTVENLVRAREQTPGQFEEILQESGTTLLAEIANLKSIVGRFSEFAQMPQPKLQSMDLNEAVAAVARLYQPQLQRPDHPILLNLALAEGPVPIQADPDLLHRAISNLVLNAIDAMPEGGELTLRTGRSPGWSRLEVADTGVGLTEEECRRLFTPYYTSKQHGTGLGLAIVQSVVSDHGGRVQVHSQSGRGTTFVVELPA